MEGFMGKRWNVWGRRVVTRVMNVSPAVLTVLLGLNPLTLLVYSRVVLSLMIPLSMIPLVYYTSRKKFMGELVNSRVTIALAMATVVLVVAFNAYLLITIWGNALPQRPCGPRRPSSALDP
jgi:manganese transport protein